MRKLFYSVRNDAGLLEARKAIRTGAYVCLEGGNAKTLLIIEEEVDLSRKKMTVVHERVYAAGWKVVSAKRMQFESRVNRR